MEIEEQVYATLLKSLEEESELPWVTPIFIPGHPCYDAYCEMHAAYGRLRRRLSAEDEDADVEEIIDCLLRHGKLLSMEMFRYGRLYQGMQDEISGTEQK